MTPPQLLVASPPRHPKVLQHWHKKEERRGYSYSLERKDSAIDGHNGSRNIEPFSDICTSRPGDFGWLDCCTRVLSSRPAPQQRKPCSPVQLVGRLRPPPRHGSPAPPSSRCSRGGRKRKPDLAGGAGRACDRRPPTTIHWPRTRRRGQDSRRRISSSRRATAGPPTWASRSCHGCRRTPYPAPADESAKSKSKVDLWSSKGRGRKKERGKGD